MATVYNKSRIMRNAWYLKGVEPAEAFAAGCLDYYAQAGANRYLGD